MANDFLPEPARARQWRERLGLSRAALGKRIGYSVEAIADFELGRHRSSKAQISERSWTTYRLACAAVAAGFAFDWGPVTIQVSD